MPGHMKTFLRNTVFFIGWLLSPLTFWNDAFVNIPIAYLLANISIRFFPSNFLFTVMAFYWLSNIAGLLMMYISGKSMIRNRKDVVKQLISLVITMLVYSAVLVILNKVGILKPL